MSLEERKKDDEIPPINLFIIYNVLIICRAAKKAQMFRSQNPENSNLDTTSSNSAFSNQNQNTTKSINNSILQSTFNKQSKAPLF